MTLKEQMAKDVIQFINIDEFAENVSYNGVDINAVVERGMTRADGNEFTSDAEADRAQIWVLASDVAKPAVGDSVVTTDGTQWEVSRIIESDGFIYQLECIANERLSYS